MYSFKLVEYFIFILGLAASDANQLKKDLQSSRNYLKTDYKVHISCQSTVPDHCSIFALSDVVNDHWKERCDHAHDQKCYRCELLKLTLSKIRTFIEKHQTNADLCERFLYRFEQQIQCIDDWKAHLLRTIHQDLARTHVLNNLASETVMVHIDWAMKWLPTKFRESTVSSSLVCLMFSQRRGRIFLSWDLVDLSSTHTH